jgi:hypothetical protein
MSKNKNNAKAKNDTLLPKNENENDTLPEQTASVPVQENQSQEINPPAKKTEQDQQAQQAPLKQEKKTEKKVNNDPFKMYPNLDVYYQTSDGTAFFTQNAAENHAKTLENKTVTKITK